MAFMRTQVRCDCLLVFFTPFPLLAMLPETVFSKKRVWQHCRTRFSNSGLPAIVPKVQKIASDNIVKSDGARRYLPTTLSKCSLQTFRQHCQKVTACRRHWGQGISPASGVLTSKRYACALTALGGEGLGPANGGAFPQWQIDWNGRAEPVLSSEGIPLCSVPTCGRLCPLGVIDSPCSL